LITFYHYSSTVRLLSAPPLTAHVLCIKIDNTISSCDGYSGRTVPWLFAGDERGAEKWEVYLMQIKIRFVVGIKRSAQISGDQASGTLDAEHKIGSCSWQVQWEKSEVTVACRFSLPGS
jgi:hypothetical protein